MIVKDNSPLPGVDFMAGILRIYKVVKLLYFFFTEAKIT